MADESLAGVIVAGFLGDIPAQIEKLERFLQHHGMEGVERQAHSIKGAAANVGGEAVREIALKIEAAGRVADAAAAEAGMDELRRRFAALAEAIRFDAGRRG
ncbi:MAG: Hpt domain-containing protein [Deltaproteobacteria bacterium]|nr:Hpt domain-containing protein [Candidatus Anaeroferrophillacea bacterium]